MQTFKIGIILIALPAILLFTGCQNFEEYRDVLERINESSGPVVINNVSEVTLTVSTVPVSQPYQGGSFYTDTRKDDIGRFPCSSCHNGKQAAVTEAREIAHGEIVLNHGAVTNPDACDTCHHPTERDFLQGENGRKIDFDHSYQKCAQCHFRQEKDWIGGAHGKRLTYWEGTRVVVNCTSCHNPHSPRFEKRWPATFSPPDVVLLTPGNGQDNH